MGLTQEDGYDRKMAMLGAVSLPKYEQLRTRDVVTHTYAFPNKSLSGRLDISTSIQFKMSTWLEN